MATVPHVISGSGLRKFQADGFLFDSVYAEPNVAVVCSSLMSCFPGILFSYCLSDYEMVLAAPIYYW